MPSERPRQPGSTPRTTGRLSKIPAPFVTSRTRRLVSGGISRSGSYARALSGASERSALFGSLGRIGSGTQSRARVGARRVSLLCAQAGPHWLVFDLRTILALEGHEERVSHRSIVGPIDLRAWLEVEATGESESVLVPSSTSSVVYRLLLCHVGELIQSELHSIHPVPEVLRGLAGILHLKAIVELPESTPARLAYLVDPEPLAEAAWAAQENR